MNYAELNSTTPPIGGRKSRQSKQQKQQKQQQQQGGKLKKSHKNKRKLGKNHIKKTRKRR